MEKIRIVPDPLGPNAYAVIDDKCGWFLGTVTVAEGDNGATVVTAHAPRYDQIAQVVVVQGEPMDIVTALGRLLWNEWHSTDVTHG